MGPRLHNGPGINPLQRDKRETHIYIYIYIKPLMLSAEEAKEFLEVIAA